jgi:hypothetical protein
MLQITLLRMGNVSVCFRQIGLLVTHYRVTPTFTQQHYKNLPIYVMDILPPLNQAS